MTIAVKELGTVYTVGSVLDRALKLGPSKALTLSGLYGSSKAFLLASLFRRLGESMLVVLPTEAAAESFKDDLSFFLGTDKAIYYPSTETLPFDDTPTHREISGRRIETLFRLLDPEPNICTVSAPNLMARVVPKDGLALRSLHLSVGEESSMEAFTSTLSALGYSRMSMVEERGEMSVRGGIVDLFSPGYASPVRIEFFGDSVESIRSFEISTQRSLKELTELRVLPSRVSPSASASRARQRLIERANLLALEPRRLEALSRRLRETDGTETADALLPLFYESPLDTILDYINPRGIIAVIDPSMTEATFVEFSSDIEAAAGRLHNKGAFFVEPAKLYMEPEEVSSALKRRRSILIEPLKSSGLECLSESNMPLTHTLAAGKAAGGRENSGFLAPLAQAITERLKGKFVPQYFNEWQPATFAIEINPPGISNVPIVKCGIDGANHRAKMICLKSKMQKKNNSH